MSHNLESLSRHRSGQQFLAAVGLASLAISFKPPITEAASIPTQFCRPETRVNLLPARPLDHEDLDRAIELVDYYIAPDFEPQLLPSLQNPTAADITFHRSFEENLCLKQNSLQSQQRSLINLDLKLPRIQSLEIATGYTDGIVDARQYNFLINTPNLSNSQLFELSTQLIKVRLNWELASELIKTAGNGIISSGHFGNHGATLILRPSLRPSQTGTVLSINTSDLP